MKSLVQWMALGCVLVSRVRGDDEEEVEITTNKDIGFVNFWTGDIKGQENKTWRDHQPPVDGRIFLKSIGKGAGKELASGPGKDLYKMIRKAICNYEPGQKRYKGSHQQAKGAYVWQNISPYVWGYVNDFDRGANEVIADLYGSLYQYYLENGIEASGHLPALKNALNALKIHFLKKYKLDSSRIDVILADPFDVLFEFVREILMDDDVRTLQKARITSTEFLPWLVAYDVYAGLPGSRPYRVKRLEAFVSQYGGKSHGLGNALKSAKKHVPTSYKGGDEDDSPRPKSVQEQMDALIKAEYRADLETGKAGGYVNMKKDIGMVKKDLDGVMNVDHAVDGPDVHDRFVAALGDKTLAKNAELFKKMATHRAGEKDVLKEFAAARAEVLRGNKPTDYFVVDNVDVAAKTEERKPRGEKEPKKEDPPKAEVWKSDKPKPKVGDNKPHVSLFPAIPELRLSDNAQQKFLKDGLSNARAQTLEQRRRKFIRVKLGIGA